MCNVSVAKNNLMKGLCPVAMCPDVTYAKDCKWVDRVYNDSYGTCCLKQCHLENDNNETCSAIALPCSVSVAEQNTWNGVCPVAKCIGNERYPKDCKRVKRTHVEGGTCCLKLCHLENGKNETCTMIDNNQYQSNSSYNKKIDKIFPSFLLVMFMLLLMIKKY